MLLSKSAPPSAHLVFVNGQPGGKCLQASFRTVFSLSGIEFVLAYARESGNARVTYSSRVRPQGVGAGGREQILVNGQDVDRDDVLIGMDDSAGPGSLYVEFRFSEGGKDQSVKFVAPISAFK